MKNSARLAASSSPSACAWSRSYSAFFPRPEERDLHQAWADGFAAALANGGPGVYANFLADEGTRRVREAYPGTTWNRLVDVKRRYDPSNVFRLNQNVPPSSS